jgi:hypothetical protein
MDDERLAAEALVELSQQKINELEAAALTILDLNKLDITTSNEELIDLFQRTPLKTVEENAEKLAEYGIIPPVEIVDDVVTGGMDSVAVPAARQRRQALPSIRLREIAEAQQALQAAKDAPRLAAEQEEARRRSLVGKRAVEIPESYDDLDPFLKDLDVCRPNSASTFMKALFPVKAVESWTKTLKKNCRDIYEHGSVEAQCNNTIEKVNRSTDVCYICGFGFYESKDDPDLIAEYPDEEVRQGVEPTCEHILPIIQAIFFLDLYRPTDKGRLTEQQLSILKKEYSWAHECCNLVKSDNSFLVTKITKKTHIPSWDFNSKYTKELLEKISETVLFKGIEVVQSQIDDVPGWIKQRTDYIRDNKIKPIVEYIASRGMGGTMILIGLGNCVDSSKLHDKFLEELKIASEGDKGYQTTDTGKRRKTAKGGKNVRRTRKNRK